MLTLTYPNTEMRIPHSTKVSPKTEEFLIKKLYQDMLIVLYKQT